jgi:hypothetical protein
MAARVKKQAAALAKTVRALRSEKALTDAHAGLVAAAEGMAAQLDGDECGNAALWKEYRSALVSLVELGADDDNDAHAAVLALVRPPVPSKVGNPAQS